MKWHQDNPNRSSQDMIIFYNYSLFMLLLIIIILDNNNNKHFTHTPIFRLGMKSWCKEHSIVLYRFDP